MKTKLLALLILVICLSCQKENYQEQPSLVLKDKADNTKGSDNASDLLEKLKFNDLVSKKSNNSWREIDLFYRSNKDKYPENKAFKNYLCSKVVLTFASSHPFSANPNEDIRPIIAFYAEEYRKIGGSNLSWNYYLLQPLKGYWANDKLKDYKEWSVKQGKKDTFSFKKERERLLKSKKTPKEEKFFLEMEIEECNHLLSFVDKLEKL